MTSITPIVEIVVDRQTNAVTQTGFGVALCVGIHRRFTEVSKKYADMEAISADFETSDKEYIASNDYFSQEPNPEAIVIGRRKVADTSVVTVSSAVAGELYRITINGTDFDHTPAGTPTVQVIAAALTSAINGGSAGVGATDNLDGTIDLDQNVAGTPYTLKVEGLLAIADYVTSQAIDADLNDILDNADNFYCLTSTTRNQAEQLLLASWVASRTKVAFLASNESTYINETVEVDETSLAAKLKLTSNFRAGSIYSEESATRYPDLAVAGDFLPEVPGSYTQNYKTLIGITVSDLTQAQIDNALLKYGNVFRIVGNENLMSNGRFSDNTPIDEVHFIDWITARAQEGIFALIINSKKIPYTNPGIMKVVNVLQGVIGQGIDVGGIATDPAPVYDIPNKNDIPTNDIANRILPDIGVEFYLAGAIEFVKIRMTVRL